MQWQGGEGLVLVTSFWSDPLSSQLSPQSCRWTWWGVRIERWRMKVVQVVVVVLMTVVVTVVNGQWCWISVQLLCWADILCDEGESGVMVNWLIVYWHWPGWNTVKENCAPDFRQQLIMWLEQCTWFAPGSWELESAKGGGEGGTTWPLLVKLLKVSVKVKVKEGGTTWPLLEKLLKVSVKVKVTEGDHLTTWLNF